MFTLPYVMFSTDEAADLHQPSTWSHTFVNKTWCIYVIITHR